MSHYPYLNWKEDSGRWETALFVVDNDEGTVLQPPPLEKLHGQLMVPDIYSAIAKIAIEFQEQPKRKKHRGRLSKKGHTEFSDESKDMYYKHGKIIQIKIWDDNEKWFDTIDKKMKELGYTKR